MRGFSVTRRGVYFLKAPVAPELPPDSAQPPVPSTIAFWDASSGRTRKIGMTAGPVLWGLSTSISTQQLAYTQYDQSGSDIVVVPNFR